MFLRVKRQALDPGVDAVMAAASTIGAPVTQDSSGLLLKVISVSGEQLLKLESKLHQYIREEPSLGEDPVVKQVLEELEKCSHLYLMSTSIEFVAASDNSSGQYQQIRQMDLRLMPKFVDFRDECSRFIQGLQSLTA